MNANELADYLDNNVEAMIMSEQQHIDQAATMLRQQQAELDALKKDNKELHAIAQRMAMAESDARKSLQWFKDARERQSEPVAWMSVELDGRTVLATYEFETAIPLYTHPAKTLTDEVLVAHVPLMAWEVFSSSLFILENNEITNDEFIKRCYEVVKARCNHPQPDYTQFNTQVHPFKTLTDEEIDAVGDAVSNLIDTYAGRREFARAILRKAQEK